jgi:short-subunit dehydrogenase
MSVWREKTHQDKVVWIIGASSGIGEALAKELASRGAILALSSRRTQALESVKRILPGNRHEIFTLDVSDQEAVMAVTKEIHAHFGRIDSVMILSAAYKPMKMDGLDLVDVRQIIEINLLSAFYIVHAVLPLLKQQPYGQIALCGSVAGYIGLPAGQPYSATKAGIINLAETLRGELPETIDVKLINPGFVKTALTDKNTFDMPMMIEPDEAAKSIADGLLKKGFEIHCPKKFTFFVKLMRLLPYALSMNITRKLNR